MQTETRTTVDNISAPGGQSVTVLRLRRQYLQHLREPVLGAWQNTTGGPVLLDFSKVDYINSSGIALIIQMLMEADKTGRKVAAFGLRRTSGRSSPWSASPSAPDCIRTSRLRWRLYRKQLKKCFYTRHRLTPGMVKLNH